LFGHPLLEKRRGVCQLLSFNLLSDICQGVRCSKN
jgi:hypothetical protein